jgi:hypothetical protein
VLTSDYPPHPQTLQRVKSAFALDSFSDRRPFASELLRIRTACRGSGEKGRIDASPAYASPISAVRLREEESRKLGLIADLTEMAAL